MYDAVVKRAISVAPLWQAAVEDSAIAFPLLQLNRKKRVKCPCHLFLFAQFLSLYELLITLYTQASVKCPGACITLVLSLLPSSLYSAPL